MYFAPGKVEESMLLCSWGFFGHSQAHFLSLYVFIPAKFAMSLTLTKLELKKMIDFCSDGSDIRLFSKFHRGNMHA